MHLRKPQDSIMNAIDDKCINYLKHKRKRYAIVTPLELITSIWEMHNNIDDVDQTFN